MALKFYTASVISFLFFTLTGFFVGAKLIIQILYKLYGSPYGEETLAFMAYSMIFSLLSSLFGFLVALIIIRRLGKRWGSQLNFGKHPVLKLTVLAFLSFLGLLILILYLIQMS